MAVAVHVEHVNFLRSLTRLQAKAEAKVYRVALRAAAKPLLTDARQRVPSRSGLYRKSLRLRAIKRNRKKIVGVSLQTGAQWFGGKTYYGAFVNFGHGVGKRSKSQRRSGRPRNPAASMPDGRKRIPGRHDIEKTYESLRGQVLTDARQRIAAGLKNVIREVASTANSK